MNIRLYLLLWVIALATLAYGLTHEPKRVPGLDFTQLPQYPCTPECKP